MAELETSLLGWSTPPWLSPGQRVSYLERLRCPPSRISSLHALKLLLDTNAWIFFFQDSPELSSEAAEAIEDPANDSFIGIASLWEASIKIGLKKLKLPYDLRRS